MKSLRNYLAEAEYASENPVIGDIVEFIINEELAIEASVIDIFEDSVILDLSEPSVNLLESIEPISELSPKTYSTYAKAAQQDMSRHAAAAKTKRHVRGVEDWEAEEHEQEVKRRARGLDRAQRHQRMGENTEQDVDPLRDADPYEMGYRAAALYHKSRSSNPFDENSGKYYEWEDGWREGAAEEGINEAEYQGREVKLGKPMPGDQRKFKVYVKDPKTGNVKKVNFGDPNMEIRRDDPARRKSFRARHGCGTPRASDRTKAAYWSCRMWSSKPVSKILKDK